MKVWKRGNKEGEIIETSIDEVLKFIIDNNEIECDTETTGLDPHINDIICIQFGNEHNQYLIEWSKEIPELLKPFLEDSSKLYIFHNAKFDLQFLFKYNIIVHNVYDTFLAECVLTCGTLSRRGLQSIAFKYLNIDISKTVREEFVNRSNIVLSDNLHLINYGLDDVRYLTKIKKAQEEYINFYNLQKAVSLDNRFVVVLAHIEYNGMAFDKEQWLKVAEDNENTGSELLKEMDSMVIEMGLTKFYDYADLFSSNSINKGGVNYSTTIKWTSSKQVASLFKEIGIDVSVEEGGEIKESVGNSLLQKIENDYPLVKLYSKYVKNQKLISSFGKKYLNFINPVTNRIHTSYKQILNTGRMSSGNQRDNKPNLQQLPADPRFRKCFVPEKNNVLIAADYSGMESVVFANKTEDKGLLEFYDNGYGDMHSFIAKKCFPDQLENVKLEDVKTVRKDLRQDAKAAGFAIQFGGNGSTISDNLGIPLEEGEATYEAYMEGFPGVKNYFKKVFNETLVNGYITFNDITNRKSFFDFIDYYKELSVKIENIDWSEYRREKSANSIKYNNHFKPIVKDYFKYKGIIERRSYNYP